MDSWETQFYLSALHLVKQVISRLYGLYSKQLLEILQKFMAVFWQITASVTMNWTTNSSAEISDIHDF